MASHHKRVVKELARPGQRVQKLSGKPFKSSEKVNTVKSVTTNPQHPDNPPAYTFIEDDSVVGAAMCEIVRGDAC
jgi:hypothetical protein